MSAFSDAALLTSIADGPWERLQALSTLHAEVLAVVDESCTLENLALLEVVETILQTASTPSTPPPASTQPGWVDPE
jgi:hypothetical protein